MCVVADKYTLHPANFIPAISEHKGGVLLAGGGGWLDGFLDG